MLCQKCGQAEACVHRTDIIEGEKRQLLLCQACAASEGLAIDPALIQATASHIQKLITPLVQAVGQSVGLGVPQRPVASPCPECGITWDTFRKKSRFGCPHDYEHFQPVLDELFLSLHGSNRHRGRVPRAFFARRQRKERLVSLKSALAAAVRDEEFERAAALRDEIRNLEMEDSSS